MNHTETHVALPLCSACRKPISFYMHQDYSKAGGMRYYHPACCPTCTREHEAAS